jgi:hypothetical protein
MHFTLPQFRASLFGGIFLLVGLTTFGMSVVQTYQDRRFAREGRSTQGIVLTKSTRTSESSHANGTRSRTTHYETT